MKNKLCKGLGFLFGIMLIGFTLPSIIDGINYYLYTPQGEILFINLVVPYICTAVLIFYWLLFIFKDLIKW